MLPYNRRLGLLSVCLAITYLIWLPAHAIENDDYDLVVPGEPPDSGSNLFSPAGWMRALVFDYMHWRKYFHGTPEKSLFDGSGGGDPTITACEKIYRGNNSMYLAKDEPDALACALMICGHDRFHRSNPNSLGTALPQHYDMCSWFDYLYYAPRNRDEFRQTLQDLKNYLALLDIEAAKEKASAKLIHMPGNNKAIFSGVKFDIFGQLVLDRLGLFDSDFINNIYFVKPYQANSSIFLKERMRQFCSDREEGLDLDNANTGSPTNTNAVSSIQSRVPQNVIASNSDKTALCQSVGYALPLDLHAQSLLRHENMGPFTTELAGQQYIKHLFHTKQIPLLATEQIYLEPNLALRGRSNNPDFPSVYLLSETGKRHMKFKMMEMMVLTATQETFRRLFNRRRVIDRDNSDPIPAGITPLEHKSSVYATLKQEANRRYHDPQWFQALHTAPKVPLLREATVMMATELAISEKTVSELDRLEALLAIELSVLVQNEIGSNVTVDDIWQALGIGHVN